MSESKECSPRRKSVHFSQPQSSPVHEIQPLTLATFPSNPNSPDTSSEPPGLESSASTISTLLPAFQTSIPKRGRCRCQNAPWITAPPSGGLGLIIRVVEQEILRVFSNRQPTFTEILRISSADLDIPPIDNRAWDLCQVVVSSRPISSPSPTKLEKDSKLEKSEEHHHAKSEKLLVGDFATGAFRAYQSVLRLLTLLPNGVVMEREAGIKAEVSKIKEASKGRQVLGLRDFAVHEGVERICTVCARIVLKVPRSLSKEMLQTLMVGFE